ncbi:glycosyltransferase family 4 protein [Aeromonas caviae]|uniref:glycosyltransferase family 4 protein n=1 Tax=Aeromonas TaxID=642 RepID=UPI002B46F991|nr:glycosyltransferase family 4 protein [Aeromonas caviae]
MKIHIIQPSVPKYRVAFFQKISRFYDVNIIAAKKDFLGVTSNLEIKNVSYLSEFFSYWDKFFWLKGLPLIKGYSKDDVVIINGNPRILNFMLLFIFLKLRSVKTVWWGHGWSAGSRGILSRIRIKMMRLADAVLLYTDYEKERIGINNCYALNNGLDSSEIDHVIKAANTERSYEPPIKSLVFIGRLTEKANFSFLLEALAKTKCNCSLNVIGGGDKDIEFKALADELGVSHRVNWFGSVFDEAEIAKIMLNSHAFIYTGAVGLSLIHAFNYGLPAIVHDSREGHMPEFAAFIDKYNGFSFISGDIDDAANKIDFLFSLSNDEQLKLSNNAKETVNISYNIDDMVQRFNRLISKLVCNENTSN